MRKSMNHNSISKSVVIEFVGIPGVGKSTISRRVGAELVSQNFQVSEPIARISDRSVHNQILSMGRFVTEHAVRSPQKTLSGTSNLIKSEQASPLDYVRVGLNLQYVAGVVEHARSRSEITLLDQGPYQGVWSVGLRSDIDWDSLLNRFGQFLLETSPDLIIFVEADINTIEERLCKRAGNSTRFGTSTQSFNRGLIGYEKIKQRVRSTHSSDSMIVENETVEDLELSVTHIMSVVESLFERI